MKYTLLFDDSMDFDKKSLKYKYIEYDCYMIEEETLNSFLELKEYFKDFDISIVNENDYIDKKLGLALELNINDKSKYNDVIRHLYLFGFIIRYPEGKEKITGYNYLPYYIRYVGKIPAKIIYENSLCLEEYVNSFGCVLYVNKPKDITSFDVVNEIKHLFGIKRVGHTGTLDPLAEGVMLVCVGQACKIVELLTANDKEYVATAKLGIKTDTYDIYGKIIDTKKFDISFIGNVINSYRKSYMQEAPIYSAIKVDGKKLYDYARNNIDIELPKREVTIKEIELLTFDKDTFSFRTLVSKGTYIRSLINDIGNSLGTYATMTNLIRTKQGNVTLEETDTLEDIKNYNFSYYMVDDVLNYPIIIVEDEIKIKNGVKIPNSYGICDKVIFKNSDNKLLGIYEVKDNLLCVWKNFI